jgi:hypothetical protein
VHSLVKRILTNIHVWSHLAQFFSEWEMFQTTVVEEILYRKLKHTFYVQFFFRKSFRLWDNGAQHRRAGQATDDNMARIHTHTHTHSQYVTLTAFPLQQWLQERASMLRCSPLSILLTPTIRCIKKTVKITNWYDIHKTKANSFLRYLVHIKKHVDLLPYLSVRI